MGRLRFRRQSADPFHPVTVVVKKRVSAEGSVDRIGPGDRSRARLWLLSQEGNDGSRGLSESARGIQSEVPNRMLIVFQKMLRPTVNEFLRRALDVDSAIKPLVFSPKRDALLANVGDAMLRDWWPPHIATCISKEVLFGLED